MKKIIGIVIAILVVIALIPFWLGYIAEHIIKRNLALTASPIAQAVQISNYQRSWLQSSFDIHFNFEPAIVTPLGDINGYQGHVRLYHGPLLWFANLEGQEQMHDGIFGLSGNVHLLSNSDAISSLPSLRVTGVQEFNGNLQNQYALAALQLQPSHTQFKLSFDSLVGQTTATSGFQRIMGQFKLSNLNFNNTRDAINVTIPTFDWLFDLSRNARGFWLGDKKLTAPDISLQAANAASQLQQVSWHVVTHAEGDNLDAKSNLSIASIRSGITKYGPLEFDVNLSHVQQDAFIDLLKAAQMVRQDQDNSKLNKTQQNQLLQQLTKVLAGSYFKINRLSCVMPMGEFDITGFASFANVDSNSQAKHNNAEQQNLLLQLLQNSRMGLNVSLSPKLYNIAVTFARVMNAIENPPQPKPIAPQHYHTKLQNWLNVLSEKGIFEKNGDWYVVRLSYQNHTFFVNDQPGAKIVQKLFAS